MVHADATNFSPNLTKPEAYQQLLDEVEGLFYEQRNWVCVANVNWAGFYVLDPTSSPSKPRLILGPFQGKVACQTINFGRGVCGTAAATQTTQLVPDVEKFPGHIACDSSSKSEIVVPIIVEGKGVVGIIDIDCTVENGFDEVDKEYLEKLADFIAKSSDWP
ncbi:GAF domain-like protein [Apiosordaria backusii]|uniref:GAF domain-like protein n=1 Tax=Apiosordaria backusii TaxID=314023 RepID=A0AA40K443_9PEZI|nr:GAF domain-like protein [Apiosordaria backusii]